MTLLSSPLKLHDIEDVEAHARAALRDHLRQGAGPGESKPSRLSPDDFEDALSWLISVCWDASRFYGPAALQPAIRSERPFSLLAYWLMRRRVVDWYRSRFGSTRYKARPLLVSYDEQEGSAAPPEVLGLELSLSARERAALLCVAQPFAASGLTAAGFAREAEMPRAWVEQGLSVTRAALERQGLKPSARGPALPLAEEAECLAPSSAAAAAS